MDSKVLDANKMVLSIILNLITHKFSKQDDPVSDNDMIGSFTDFKKRLYDLKNKLNISDRWVDISKKVGYPMWQNKTNPLYFSNDFGKTKWCVEDSSQLYDVMDSLAKQTMNESINSNINIKLITEIKSINSLLRSTPPIFKQRAKDVVPRLITKTKNGKYIYRTTTKTNGNVHNQFIKPIPPYKQIKSFDDDVIVWCDCGNFTYENEYSLWKADASHIVNSNGQFPKIRNPRLVKKMCKHMVAILTDFKNRMSKV